MPALVYYGPSGAVDELNIWALPQVETPREFAFAGVQPAPELPRPTNRYEVDLRPSAADAAQIALASRRLLAGARAVPHIEGRVQAFLAAGGAVDAAWRPEQELAAWVTLDRLQAPAAHYPAPAALARGFDIRNAQEEVSAFFEKVRDAVSNYASVVSRIEGAPVAVTKVSWTGDFRVSWRAGLTPDDAARHQDTVTLALRTRDLWLRLALTVIRSAAQLAALFATNPLLALPAAYRFAREVIAQAQALAAPAPA